MTDGFQPGIRETCTALGIRFPNGLMAHLKGLHKKGWIRLRPAPEAGGSRLGHPSRAIVFLKKFDGSPFEGFTLR